MPYSSLPFIAYSNAYDLIVERIDKLYKDEVEKLGEVIAKCGFSLVYGAGATGCMGAIARSVREQGGHIMGITPDFIKDFEDIFPCDNTVMVDTMAERKTLMEKHADVFIITPFVNQKEMLQTILKSKGIDDVDCGTIHSIQGAERSTIIFSTALSEKTSKKTFEWIKDNYELINVAITRAKNKLIIAADTEVIDKLSDKKDDLYQLIQYAKNNGETVVPANETIKLEIGKSNGSVNEDEFFKTVSHFCSCHKTFEAERNVPLTKLFRNEGLKSNQEFDLVLYEKNFFSKKPVIAFEVNGGEHFGFLSRERSDRRKMDICSKHGVKLIFIQNSFVKAYEYIADIILSSKDKDVSIQQSLFND